MDTGKISLTRLSNIIDSQIGFYGYGPAHITGVSFESKEDDMDVLRITLDNGKTITVMGRGE